MVSVQVVQRQVLATSAAAQGEVMVVVGRGSGGRVVFVGDGSGPAPLAHHHPPQLARAAMCQRHVAAADPSAGRWQVDELRLLGLQVYGEFGKGPGRHLGHLLDVAPLLPAEVQELLDLPQEDAHGEEEEEAGEEDGEEDKEVDVGLVLPQEQQALRLALPLHRAHAPQGYVEAAGLERVHLVREGDDHAVSNAADDQHCLRLPHRDVGDQAFGSLLPDLFVRTRRLCLQLQGVVGEHGAAQAGRRVGEHLDGGRRRLFVGYGRRTPRPRLVLDPDGVDAREAVHVHHEDVVRGGDIDLHLAERDIDGDTDVHVGELWLSGEEHGTAFGQVPDGGVVEAVGLGRGVEAALCVHVELTVALAPLHRGAVEGVFALGALIRREMVHKILAEVNIEHRHSLPWKIQNSFTSVTTNSFE